MIARELELVRLPDASSFGSLYRQRFDRDLALRPGIADAIYLVTATHSELAKNFIRLRIVPF